MLETYKGLTKIDDFFKILEIEEEHINADFLINFISLIMMRLLQNIIKEDMSSQKIQEALREFKCINVDNYRVFKKNKNDNIKIVLDVLGIENELKAQDVEILKKNMRFTLSNISR
ncbi:hypothetical protein [Streptobacillus moniliformis]|uniref:hypothetical protein n=1 Tax=Streptobacillus moniliformis TaxID=34105 RepID=UPI0007E4AE03|nr:hypothetical protein [Streptobacillus moniliformis]